MIDETGTGIIKTVSVAIGIGLIVLLLLGSFYIVSAGERAVVLTLGKPDMVVKGEGLNFKIPLIQSRIIMDVRTQKYEADLTAASKDLQDVATKIAINYRIVPEQVPEIYTTIGTNYAEKIIYPLEQETNKGVTSLFTAEELITKREVVRQQMKDSLAEKLRPRGIIVEEVSIINFAFSPSFTAAIEQKVTAEQNALGAKNKLAQVQYEAQQTITKASAEAEALRLKKQSITPELVQLSQIEVQSKALDVQKEAIAKWNGILPSVTGGAMPFIDINNLNKQTQQ